MNRLGEALICFLLTLSTQTAASSAFVGYEFGQMAFNGFKNFAGEVGYNLDNGASVRLSFLNVALTERHLSSGEASAVDGDNVEGLWRGAEIIYDFPITEHLFFSPSVGYYDTKYSHTILDQSIRNQSSTAGVAISYTDNGIFGISSLYWRFSLSYRHYFNPLERTNLGDSVVNGGSAEVTPINFVGYRFE